MLHLKHSELQSVDQRSPTERMCRGDFFIYPVRSRREGHSQLGALGEFNQKEFITLVRGFEKRFGSGGRYLHLPSHAAAGVEHQSHGKRRILAGKRCNPLLRSILEKTEVLNGQVCRDRGASKRLSLIHI